MKKYIGIALAVLMVLGLSGMAVAAPQKFPIQVKVEEYVAFQSGYTYGTLSGLKLSGPSFAGGPVFYPDAGTGIFQKAYANCKFKVSLSGNNALWNAPVLIRKETEPPGNYDRLATCLGFRVFVNGTPQDSAMKVFGQPGGGWYGKDWLNFEVYPGSITLTSNDVPHDGDISLSLRVQANGPDVDYTDNEWYESADAGTYTCNVFITYTTI